MKTIWTALIGLAFAAGSSGQEKPKATARTAAEGYVAAALAGKVDDAVALAVEGQSPARRGRIKEFKELIGAKSLQVAKVVASEKAGRAIAVTAGVKLKRPNPDGRDAGRVVLALVATGGKWLVRDVDFRAEEGAKEMVKAFQAEYPDAREVQGKAKE